MDIVDAFRYSISGVQCIPESGFHRNRVTSDHQRRMGEIWSKYINTIAEKETKEMTFKELVEERIHEEDVEGAIKLIEKEYGVGRQAAAHLANGMLERWYADQEDKMSLEASIQHWEEMYTAIVGTRMTPEACALCAKYRKVKGPSVICSDKCPVKKKTGVGGCKDTPFGRAYRMRSELVDAVIREIRFLKSLRK